MARSKTLTVRRLAEIWLPGLTVGERVSIVRRYYENDEHWVTVTTSDGRRLDAPKVFFW